MASAQMVRLSYGPGIGAYSMKPLKDLNRYSIQNLPFAAKLTDNFPVTISHEVTLSLSVKRFGIGFSYDYNTTGSRITYKDYSGQYTDDLSLEANLPSLFINYIAIRYYKLDVEVQTRAGYISTSINNHNLEKIDEEMSENHLYATSESWFVNPAVSFVYKPFRIVNVGISAGYLYDFRGKVKNNDGLKFINPQTTKAVKTDWSGFRANVSIMVNIENLFNRES
jgi:hypothetical protein